MQDPIQYVSAGVGPEILMSKKLSGNADAVGSQMRENYALEEAQAYTCQTSPASLLECLGYTVQVKQTMSM